MDDRLLRAAAGLATITGLEAADVEAYLERAIDRGQLSVLDYIGISRRDVGPIELIDVDRDRHARRDAILRAAEKVIAAS